MDCSGPAPTQKPLKNQVSIPDTGEALKTASVLGVFDSSRNRHEVLKFVQALESLRSHMLGANIFQEVLELVDIFGLSGFHTQQNAALFEASLVNLRAVFRNPRTN